MQVYAYHPAISLGSLLSEHSRRGDIIAAKTAADVDLP